MALKTSVQFFDYSIEVKNAMDSLKEKFLEEAGGLVESRVKDNTRTFTSRTKNQWQHVVSKDKVTIGNSTMNAVWEEFGTGEHSAKGRKGGWYIPEWKLDSVTKNALENKYRFKKKFGSGGRVYYYTTGKKGTEPFKKAWENSENEV